MEKTLTQEVSHEGNKFFLPSKDTIKEEGCPLDRGGVIEDKGEILLWPEDLKREG